MNREDLYNYRYNDIYIKAEVDFYKKMRARTNGIETNEMKELTARYNRIVRELTKQQHFQLDILENLKKMPNTLWRNILFMHHVNGMTLKQISIEHNLDYGMIRKYHLEALKQFDEICS